MIIDWPQDLVSDVARRRCVLVLGSGISSNSTNASGARPKTWAAFLNHATTFIGAPAAHKKEINKLIRNNEFLTACQVIRDLMGKTAFYQLTEQEYLIPRFQYAEIHDRIIELDSRIVATPNFDTIFENRINSVQHSSVAVKNYYDNDVAEAIRSTKRMVLKIHGTINSPNRMIFTRDDYTKARHENAAFYSILDALAVTHTFLFLGCGLDDPDIKLILEDYGFKHEHSRPHYFVLPSSKLHAIVKPAVEKSLNVSCLSYPAPRGDHSKLKASIQELRDLVNAERLEISTKQSW